MSSSEGPWIFIPTGVLIQFVPEVAISCGGERLRQGCNNRNAKSDGLARNDLYLPLHGSRLNSRAKSTASFSGDAMDSSVCLRGT